MKTSFVSILATVSCVTIFALPATAMIQSNVPQEVQRYAETDGLATAKKTLLVDPNGFGFNNPQEVNDLTLGIGLQVYSIDPERLQSAKSLRAIAKADQSWEFVLSSNGKVKSFLTIDKKDGKLELESVGGKAEDFQAALNTYDVQMSQQGGSPEPILLKDMTVRYLIGNKEQRELVISDVPSSRAATLGKISNAKMSDASNVLTDLKNSMENSEKQSEQKFGGTSLATSRAISSQAEPYSHYLYAATLIFASMLVIFGVGIYRGRKKQVNQ